MQRRNRLAGVLFFVILWQCYSTMPAGGSGLATLRIILQGVENEEGQVFVALAASPGEFSSSTDFFRKVRVTPTAGKTLCVLSDIPEGEYAVKAYHDRNGNGRLDKVPLFGIPIEPYGFSNNARDVFGPPDFTEARFSLDQAAMTVEIRLQ